MKAGEATKLKVGPVMPGAAALAVATSNNPSAVSNRSCPIFEFAFFIFISFIATLLNAAVAECRATHITGANMNFGHEPPEVFRVIGQVVEVGGVEVVRAGRNARGIQN